MLLVHNVTVVSIKVGGKNCHNFNHIEINLTGMIVITVKYKSSEKTEY